MAPEGVMQKCDPKAIRRRLEQLRRVRSGPEAAYRDIAELLLPRSARFTPSDHNRAKRDDFHRLLDEHGTRALRILAAGLQAGMTSPARPWFRLAVANTELMKNAEVREWLHNVAELMRSIFSRSNTYRSLHTLYETLGAFGTAAAVVLPDFENVIRLETLTTGEFWIATNDRGEVDTLYRVFEMTARNIVARFGAENVSPQVRQAAEKHGETFFPILHAIQPRGVFNPQYKDALNMPFESVYLEYAADESHRAVLSEGGFPEFPCIAPRWHVRGGDIYGDSPGLEALGSLNQLFENHRDKGRVIGYRANPPLQVPTAMRGQESELLPGGISYYDALQPAAGVRSAFDVNMGVNELLDDIRDIRAR